MAAAMAMAGTCTGCKRSFEEMEKLIIHHAYCLEPANEEEKRNFENVRQHWAQVNSSDSNKKKVQGERPYYMEGKEIRCCKECPEVFEKYHRCREHRTRCKSYYQILPPEERKVFDKEQLEMKE